MSRTYKKIPHCCVRRPRGKKQAVINNARKGAIPPDTYEDIQHDPQAWQPYHVAQDLIDKMVSDEEIHHKLHTKYHMSFDEAIRIVHFLRGIQKKYDQNQ